MQLIQPDATLLLSGMPTSDAILQSLRDGWLTFGDAREEDFIHGNIKAQWRMIAQYAVARHESGLLIGTDQAAEALDFSLTIVTARAM